MLFNDIHCEIVSATCTHIIIFIAVLSLPAERERQTDRQTDRERERQTDRERDTERERQTDRDTETDRDRDREGVNMKILIYVSDCYL